MVKTPKPYCEMSADEFNEVYESSWCNYRQILDQYKSAVEKGEMKYIGKQLEIDFRRAGDILALVCIEMRRRFGESL